MTLGKRQALDWITGTKFEIGDIVTRDGSDRQRVLDIGEHGDQMLVECIRAPLGYRNEDGSLGEPWCEIGDQGRGCPQRFH